MKEKRRSWVRIVVRSLVLAIVAVFVVLAVVLFLVTLGPGERKVKQIAESQLRDLLGQEVRIGEVETNLLSRIRMKDLEIGGGEATAPGPWLRLGTVEVRYGLFDLLPPRISVRSVALDGLHIEVLRDSLGTLNLPVLTAAPEDTSARAPAMVLPVQVGEVSLRHSTFRYRDRLILLDADVLGLDVESTYLGEDTYGYHVRLDSLGATYGDIPVAAGALDLKGQWNLQRTLLESFSMDLPGFRLTGQAEMRQDGPVPSLSGVFRLEGDPSELAEALPALIPEPLRPIRGEMRLSAQISGPLDRPNVDVSLDLPRMEAGDFAVADGEIRASWRAERAILEKLRVRVLGGTVTAEGEVGLDTLMAHRFMLNIENLDLAQVLRKALPGQEAPVGGKLALNLVSAGQGFSPEQVEVTSEVNLRQLTYEKHAVPDIAVRLQVTRGTTAFRLRQGETEVAANARLAGETLSGTFSAKIAKLATLMELANIPGLSGEVESRGTLAGSLASPEIRATFAGRNIRYQNFPVDTVEGRIEYRDLQARLSNVRFSGVLDSVDAAHPPFDLPDVIGGLRYRGTAEGPVENPRAEVMVTLSRPGYEVYRFERGEILAHLRDQQLRASVHLTKGALSAEGTVRYDLPSLSGSVDVDLYEAAPDSTASDVPDSNGRGRLDAGRIAVTLDLRDTTRVAIDVRGERLDLAPLAGLMPVPMDLGGTAGFDVSMRGRLSDPEIAVRFRAVRPRYERATMDSVAGRVRLARDRIELQRMDVYVEGHHSWMEAAIGLVRLEDGRYGVSPESMMAFEAHGEAFDLLPVNPLLPPGMRVAGHGSYDLRAHGTVGAPHVLGEFLLQDGMVQTAPEVPAVEGIEAQVSFQDSVLLIEDLHGRVQDIPWRVQGRITARRWQAVDLDLRLGAGDFGTVVVVGTVSPESVRMNARVDLPDLSVMQPFVPDLKGLSGRFHTEVAVQGSPTDPEVDGSLEVRGLSLQPPTFQERIDRGVVKIAFSRKEVRIDSLFAALGGGTALISGRVTHDMGQIADMDIKMRAADIRVVRPKEASVQLKSARFTYTRQNATYLLDGDLVLGECRVVYNFGPQALLALVQAVERPAPEMPPILQQTRMNVRVRESDRIWVDNNLARLRMQTELGVIGGLLRPNLTGRVTIREGYLLYVDRKFVITRGTVDFIDPNRPNPIVDLRAEATVRAYGGAQDAPYIVTLAISGPSDQLVVALTSDPPLEQPDIVALLTVGATREQLSGGEAGVSTSDVLLQRAAMLSSQRISGYASRKVGGLLGLDQMSIEGNLFQFDSSWGPQLLASRKLSDRMEVTYTTTVGHFNEQGVRLDYRLSKYFSLRGQTDQRGRSAIDVKYGMKFR